MRLPGEQIEAVITTRNVCRMKTDPPRDPDTGKTTRSFSQGLCMMGAASCRVSWQPGLSPEAAHQIILHAGVQKYRVCRAAAELSHIDCEALSAL